MNMFSRSRIWLDAGFVLLFLVICAWLTPCSAQDSQELSKLENRFLFILDTSSAMSHASNGTQKAVIDLVRSGMQGQLREGDTLGIWTYNDTLHTDFPMQIWSASNKQRIINGISGFLRAQRYSKKARLDRVLPEMFPLINASRTLTVVLISDGSGAIQGTKFDKDINDIHREYRQKMRDLNLPFVTILAARDGDVFDYTVNTSTGTIRVPETAIPAPVVAAPPPASLPPEKPRELRQIIIGSPVLPKTNAPIASKPAIPLDAVPAPKVDAPPAQTVGVTSSSPAASTTPAEIPKPIVPTMVEEPIKPAAVPNVPPVTAVVKKPLEAELVQTSNPVPMTQATVSRTALSVNLLLAVACVLLAIAGGIIVFLLRRLRHGADPSLISQSMRRSETNRHGEE